MAAVCIIVAAAMPPVSGGSPVMTSARSIKKGAGKAHTQKARKAHRDGAPLLHQLLETDDCAQVGNQQINAERRAERNQKRVLHKVVRQNSPVPQQQQDG